MQNYSHISTMEQGSSVLCCDIDADHAHICTSQGPHILTSNIQYNHNPQHNLEGLQLHSMTDNAGQFSEVLSSCTESHPDHEKSITSTCLSMNKPTYENPAISNMQSPVANYGERIMTDMCGTCIPISYSGDNITVPSYSGAESEKSIAQTFIAQNLPTITDGHTKTCKKLPVTALILSSLKATCPDNTNAKTHAYLCGACCQTFSSICTLHDHLISHVETGSYYYNNILRIAFPKFDSICSSTQTDNICDETPSSEDVPKSFLSNALTEIVSKTNNIYTDTDNEAPENAHEPEPMCTMPVIKNASENQSDMDNTQNGGIRVSIGNTPDTPVTCTVQVQVGSLSQKTKRGRVKKPRKLKRDGGSSCTSKRIKATKVKLATKEDPEYGIRNDGIGERKTVQVDSSNLIVDGLTEIQEIELDTGSLANTEVAYEIGLDHARKRKQTTVLKVKKVSEKLCVMCSLCSRTFRYSKSLRKHECLCHQEDLKFECNLCLEKFIRQADMDIHKLLHNSSSKRRRLKQSRSSRTIKSTGKHKTGHGRRGALNTKSDKQVGVSEDQQLVIPETQAIKSEIQVDKLAVSDEQDAKPDTQVAKAATPIFHCDLCDKRVKEKNAEIHLRLHSGERPFICEMCGKGLISACVLERHMKVHSDVRPYTCGLCTATFKDSYKLRRHQVIHSGERRYLCSTCGADFTQSASLVQHIKGVHLQIKPFTCDVCGSRFSAKRARDDHLMSHTDDRPNTCRYCGKQLKYLQGLRRHEKSHMETKKFICDTCPSSFQRKDNLLRHKQSHLKIAGECKICFKKFRDDKAYMEHMKVHLHFDGSGQGGLLYPQAAVESSQVVTDDACPFDQSQTVNHEDQAVVPDMGLAIQESHSFMNTEVGTSNLAEAMPVVLPPMLKLPNLNQNEILPAKTSLPPPLHEFGLRSMPAFDTRAIHLPDTVPCRLQLQVCCGRQFTDLQSLHDHMQQHRVHDDRPQPKQVLMESVLYNIQNL